MIYKNGIIKSLENGKAIIEVDLGDDAPLLLKQKIKECEVAFTDGRKISVKQRKYIYSIIKDIAESTGLDNEPMKEAMKHQFCITTGAKDFSLSTVDMTTAKEFLNFLVAFCVENDIPTKLSLSTIADSAYKYVYACCMNNKCCLTGKQGIIYNVETLSETVNIGDKVLPLSAKSLSDLKKYGLETFLAVNFIEPITADEEIADAAERAMLLRRDLEGDSE